MYFLILLGCLMLSLVLHWILWERSRAVRMPGFSPESYDTIVPRTFRMKHVEIDPAVFKEPLPQPTPPSPKKNPVLLSDDRPLSVERVSRDMKPPLPSPGNALNETEMPGLGGKATGGTGTSLLPSPDDGMGRGRPMAEEVLSGKTPPLPLSEIPEPAVQSPAADGGTNAKFSSIDDLLAGSVPLTAKTPPILMPTDLLFEYDSDVLKPEAEQSLRKLGSLIRQNRSSRFRIEGHTDSFGTQDYNNRLSLRRAEAVKAWLSRSMDVDPSSVTAVGLGSSHPLAPASGSIAEQRMNRRVEIVISSN